MQETKKITTGSPWEDSVGYSRAIRIGKTIEVSGTTGPGKDEYEQTQAIILSVEKVLHQLGADLTNVVRTRIYCTDITKWEEIGRAHGQYFKTIKPTTAMVEVSKLIAPEILVEIEFSAILP